MENCDDLEYIRKYYKVPAHKYTKVLFQDNKYTIIGAYGGGFWSKEKMAEA